MKTVKAVLPLVLYISKGYIDKLGYKGLRANISVVKRDGQWQSHMHVSSYDTVCKCVKCFPNPELKYA